MGGVPSRGDDFAAASGVGLRGQEDEEDLGLLDAEVNAEVAAGKAIIYLSLHEEVGHCSVEKESVYGAAVAMPQIARSVDWASTFVGLAARSYFFLSITVLIQGFLIAVMNEEALIVDRFAGKMHLCDFAADITRCPDGPNCRGPGGTSFGLERLRSFDTWSTRTFFRDALKSLFPGREGEINAAADPGEYGLEDYYCRLLCCLLFIMSVVGDLQSTLELGMLLYEVPSDAECWIRYQVPDWAEKEKAKKLHGWCELDLVKFQVAGMPLAWKALNTVLVLLPKVVIWCMLVSTGFHFLMETAGIMDLVVNCMALSFVLRIDEIVFSRLATFPTKYICANLEDLARFEVHEEERELQRQSAQRHREDQVGGARYWKKVSGMVVPKRFVYICILMAVFLVRYYHLHCDCLEDGSCVSKTVYLPENVTYSPISFMLGALGLSVDKSSGPMWSMPPG